MDSRIDSLLRTNSRGTPVTALGAPSSSVGLSRQSLRRALLVSGRDVLANGLSGLATVSGTSALVRQRFGARGVILELHDVCEPSHAALDRIASITPQHLERLLLYVEQRDWQVVDLDEVHRRLLSDRPDSRPFVAFTFDDGYRSTLKTVLPVFRKYRAPLCVNVVVEYLNRNMPDWWEALRLLLWQKTYLQLGEAWGNELVAVESVRAKRVLLNRLQSRLRADLINRSSAPLGDLWERNGVDPVALSAGSFLDWEELAELARDPLVTIGAHTLTHPFLSSLPDELARQEVTQSKLVLEQRLGRPIHHFAYPFGTPYAMSARETRLAEEAGFKTAVTTRVGHLSTDERSRLLRLPRIPVRGPKPSTRFLRTAVLGLSGLFSSQAK